MNKIAIITGASKGIGLALAKKMLSNGFTVIGTCRDGKISAIEHKNLISVKLDLKDKSSIEEFSKFVAERFNKINILINNAGIGPDLGKSNPEYESFENTFKVNVNGTVFLTESLLPHIENKGKIIIISSKLGSITNVEDAYSVAYRMSKSALNMYTKILSNRLKNSIFITAIDPGWVKTEIRISNLKNAPLTPKESAENIYTYITSEFESGTLWDTVHGKKHHW